MHTSDIPTNLWEPLSSSFNQCCGPGTAGAQGPFAQCDSFPEEPHLKCLFPFKELYDNVKDSEPMPSFLYSSANQGEVPRLEAIRADTPHVSSSPRCCTVKTPGAVSKNAELSPISTLMNQNPQGGARGISSLEASQRSLCQGQG